MATKISTNFGDFAYSSQVNSVAAHTDGSWVDISLYLTSALDDNLVFSERYYPYNGRVTLHDLSSIIEETMRNWESILAKFRITATSSDGSTDSRDIAVLYMDRIDTKRGIGLLAETQFLTTRKIITVTRDVPVPLFYIRCPIEYIDQELIVYRIIRRRRDNGEVSVKFAPQDHAGYGSDFKLQSLTITHKEIVVMAKGSSVYEYDVLGLTIEIGRRSVTILYSDVKPDLQLWFTNMFNCVELAQLRGETTTKTKVKRTEAICDVSVLLYDQSVEQTFEFQAEGLSVETAQWLTELFSSHEVRVLDRPYGDEDCFQELYPLVLVTESTAEIQDGDDELNKVKFTYRTVKKRPNVGIKYPDRIHDNTFKNQFS